jgi:hypothetical protein
MADTKPIQPVHPPTGQGNEKKLQEQVDKEAKPTVQEFSPEKKELLGKIQLILNQHGGREADIPLNSEYWDLNNRFRAMR